MAATGLNHRAFDPSLIQPGVLQGQGPSVKKTKIKEKEPAKEPAPTGQAGQTGQADDGSKLPTRLSLDQFSNSIGHRLSGNSTAQLRFFVGIFPEEFRAAQLGRAELPCKDGKPYVDDAGRVPAPFWASISALKLLRKSWDDTSDDAKAELEKGAGFADMQAIWKDGLDVSWKEFPSFVEWAVSMEAVDLKKEVQLKPHLVDSALNLLSMASQHSAPGGDPDKALAEAGARYAALLRGTMGQRRLQDTVILIK